MGDCESSLVSSCFLLRERDPRHFDIARAAPGKGGGGFTYNQPWSAGQAYGWTVTLRVPPPHRAVLDPLGPRYEQRCFILPL